MSQTQDQLSGYQLWQLQRQIEEDARKQGTAEGNWLFDDNSQAIDIRKTLRLIAENDPEWEIRSPLSGEWADDPSEEDVILAAARGAELDIELTGDTTAWIDIVSDLGGAFNDAWQSAYQAEVVRSGEARLAAPTPGKAAVGI